MSGDSRSPLHSPRFREALATVLRETDHERRANDLRALIYAELLPVPDQRKPSDKLATLKGTLLAGVLDSDDDINRAPVTPREKYRHAAERMAAVRNPGARIRVLEDLIRIGFFGRRVSVALKESESAGRKNKSIATYRNGFLADLLSTTAARKVRNSRRQLRS